MPLTPDILKEKLLDYWLGPSAGAAGSPVESGDRFARAVTEWFALGLAGPFPCATALARKAQLAGQAATALQAGLAPLAGAQLAQAVAAYMAGHAFGPGVSQMPMTAAVAQVALGAVFADLDATADVRAERIALTCQTMALSTLVVFPPVLSPPLPVL